MTGRTFDDVGSEALGLHRHGSFVTREVLATDVQRPNRAPEESIDVITRRVRPFVKCTNVVRGFRDWSDGWFHLRPTVRQHTVLFFPPKACVSSARPLDPGR